MRKKEKSSQNKNALRDLMTPGISREQMAVRWAYAAEKEAESLQSLIDTKEELAGLNRMKARAAKNKKYTELKILLQSAVNIVCKNSPNLSSKLRVEQILLEKIATGYDEKNPYIEKIAIHLETMKAYEIRPGFIRKNITLPKKSPA